MTAIQELFIGYGPGDRETVMSAVIDGNYRYELTRSWGDGPAMTFVMLNPSTADGETDDPTIRRCLSFAKREGCGGIVVVNLFALRVTRPVHLFDKTIEDDPNGPENVAYVRKAMKTARDKQAPIVAAWGALDLKRCYESEAWRQFFSTWTSCADYSVQCLGKTADRSPRHPLYLKADTPLEPWPWEVAA